MSTPIIEPCLACLFGSQDQLLGVGFLAAPRWILTAAHVLERLPEPILDTRVEITFPLAAPGARRTAWVRGYFPEGMPPGGDIAVLELDEDPPAGAHPVRLAASRHVRKHTFWAYGFPAGHDRGVWASGEILGPQAEGWLQIEATKEVGHFVKAGFSGGPLWDSQRKGVIGMILEAERETRAGFALSIEAVIERWPALPAPSPRLTQVPPLPPHYLPRPAALAALKAAVLSNAPPIAVLHGMGGAGKTVLAAALTQEADVQAAFPDGIVWIDLGDLARRAAPDVALPPDPLLPKRQEQVAEALGEEDAVFRDSREGRARLEEILREKACLIILDNGWEPEHVQAFTCLGPQGRLLVTTRDSGLAAGIPAALVPLDVLDDEQAAALLVAAGGTPGSIEDIRAVAQKCGNLPLALTMVGALRKKLTWKKIDMLLKEARLYFIKYPLPGYPYGSLLDALKVSFDALPPEDQARYRDFAIFPAGLPIPSSVLESCWGAQGLSSPAVTLLLESLLERSLLRRDGQGQISLHDLQHEYLRLSVSETEQAGRRAKLLAALRAQVQDPEQPEPSRRLAAIWLTHLRWLDHVQPQPNPQELIPYLDLLIRTATTQPEIEYLIDKAIYPTLEAHAGELDHRQALRLHHLAAALHGKMADLLPEGEEKSHALERAARDFNTALDRLAVLVGSPDSQSADRFLAARLRFVAGNVQRMRGRLTEAVALYTQAAEEAQVFGLNKMLLTVILKELAYAHVLQKEWGQAEPRVEQAYQTLQAEAAELAPELGLPDLPENVLALPAFQAICEAFALHPPEPDSTAGEAFEGLKELAAAYADVLETHSHINKGRAEASSDLTQAAADWDAAVRLAQDSLGYLQPLDEISPSLVYAHMNAAEYLLLQARLVDPAAPAPEAVCQHWRTAQIFAQRLGLGSVASDAQKFLASACSG